MTTNSSSTSSPNVYTDLLDLWIILRDKARVANRQDGKSFNPLARLKIKETDHSEILGDLFDPEGFHGQGALFLQPFLETLGVPNAKSGVWKVTVETGRVDILIWRDQPEKCAVIIENKANGAGDQPHQVYRYWHQEMFLWDPELWLAEDETSRDCRSRRFHVVYLPVDKSKSPESHSLRRPPEWKETTNPFEEVPLRCRLMPMADLLRLWNQRSVPSIPESNHRLRTFLEQYQELWTS